MSMLLWTSEADDEALDLGDPFRVWASFAELARAAGVGNDAGWEELYSVPGFAEQEVQADWASAVSRQAARFRQQYGRQLSAPTRQLLARLTTLAGMFPRPIRLVPDQPVYLTPCASTHDIRFARAFTAAWQRVPSRARLKLLKHWRTGDPELPAKVRSPRIEVRANWPGREAKEEVGRCCWLGHCLLFHAPAIEAMSQPVLRGLIVHELGHAFACALGAPGHTRAECKALPSAELSALCEETVRGVLADWDQLAGERLLDEWCELARSGRA